MPATATLNDLTVIAARENGVPFERPRKEDFESSIAFVRALYVYNDSIRSYANQEFYKQFRKAVR